MIGRKIKELRLAAGIKSLRQLSIISGITIATLSRIESGKHKRPAPETLSRIAPYLNISQDKLLELAGLTVNETTSSYVQDIYIPILASITPDVPLTEQLDISGMYPVPEPYNNGKHFAWIIRDNKQKDYPKGTVLIAEYTNDFTDGSLLVIVRNRKVQIKKAWHDGNRLLLQGDDGVKPESVACDSVFVAGTVGMVVTKMTCS